ncbi:centromere protein V-like [Limulus polyphemus]|uniref:Centromere protein V-like n=1 Tax=Limulus polyphemus TaxID=6850 RepID=A0ABM1BW90_LIMPO|nr:centromere protein V-like [Limulus polyphemus]XP_022257857.1 centromere protein V-like [Limulus polyphemus]
MLFLIRHLASVSKMSDKIENQSGKVKHTGGCHCGAVRFEVFAQPDLIIYNCNCSICTMKKNSHFVVRDEDFRLLQGEDNLTLYTFNTHMAKHYFCKTCGVQSFYKPRSNQQGIGVNHNCLESGTVRSIEERNFDGQNWELSMDIGGALELS